MSYAIIAAAFLIVGIGLMFWALRERSVRHGAERAADMAQSLRAKAQEVANNNIVRTVELERQVRAVETQLATLRGRLNEARIRLAQCGDPKAVKEWLDRELGEDEL